MARNSEKANSMLNRWLRLKSGLSAHDTNLMRRPRHTSEVEDVRTAEHWRNMVVKDVMISISRIQNASLGEFAIRDLNDEINRLIGLRKRWDERVIELGGADQRALSSSIENAHGAELKVGGGGYRYFGAAKNLPGVRELFEKQESDQMMADTYVTRAELYRMINPDYYGFRDDEDGHVSRAEAEMERSLHRAHLAEVGEINLEPADLENDELEWDESLREIIAEYLDTKPKRVDPSLDTA
ncbi:member RAS oncogene family protein [Babesia ovata]|uniref:Member RAS oncogene family protein n=1 Tax=Babesia ovata TaxID=189622 RepID=A0A2H6KA29_9APIC|nr:member RAS oncogene family protein [Babesia ovata]GBE59846.1 member RAS oncogene family protein [Babesia ovata]